MGNLTLAMEIDKLVRVDAALLKIRILLNTDFADFLYKLSDISTSLPSFEIVPEEVSESKTI